MVFNTPIFFVFFIVFLLIYGLILVQKTPRLYFILVASLVFYGAWNYKFIPLLVGSSIIDYYLALAIAGAATIQRKKLLLTFSVVMNLGILGLFKYADFLLVSAADFLTLNRCGDERHVQRHHAFEWARRARCLYTVPRRGVRAPSAITT